MPAAEVKHDVDDGEIYGVDSTPAVFVNGVALREMESPGAAPSADDLAGSPVRILLLNFRRTNLLQFRFSTIIEISLQACESAGRVHCAASFLDVFDDAVLVS